MSSESPKSESPNRNLGGLRSLQPNKTTLEKKDSPLKITEPKMQGLSSSLKLGKYFFKASRGLLVFLGMTFCRQIYFVLIITL